MFKEKDLKQLKERGISVSEADKQIQYLKKGFPFIRLSGAARIGNGIRRLDSAMLAECISTYEKATHLQCVKFVPASGAATRMFKALYEVDALCRQPGFSPRSLQNEAYRQVNECFDNLDKFAFYDELGQIMNKKGFDLKNALRNKEYHLLLTYILGEEGLNYGNMPKGLIYFHRSAGGPRTAFEEHLVEGAGYASCSKGKTVIHLTVSPEHRHLFEDTFRKVEKAYSSSLNIHFEIVFSLQKPSTDTLALDDNGEVVREATGLLHFRPGGHGALLENLNDIRADVIFIKNIDNVAPDKGKSDTYKYKKALAGLLISYQQRTHDYLRQLENKEQVDPRLINDIHRFLREELGLSLSNKILANKELLVDTMRKKLNRPIRVCGMVKNEGEPGGGPFWVQHADGSQSLQIVESTQINHRNPEQEAMFNSATHFNPVDLVCGVKDYRGGKFDLRKYVDEETGLITKKFRNGKPLRALELPGLWNGSMSDWNTVFVEVPTTTFTPVKTLHDLLRPEHQA